MKGRGNYGTLGRREGLTMVLWEKGRADYGTLGRRADWYFGEKGRGEGEYHLCL